MNTVMDLLEAGEAIPEAFNTQRRAGASGAGVSFWLEENEELGILIASPFMVTTTGGNPNGPKTYLFPGSHFFLINPKIKSMRGLHTLYSGDEEAKDHFGEDDILLVRVANRAPGDYSYQAEALSQGEGVVAGVFTKVEKGEKLLSGAPASRKCFQGSLVSPDGEVFDRLTIGLTTKEEADAAKGRGKQPNFAWMGVPSRLLSLASATKKAGYTTKKPPAEGTDANDDVPF